MDETSVYSDTGWPQPTPPQGDPYHSNPADAPTQVSTAFRAEETVQAGPSPEFSPHPPESGQVPYMQPSPVTTGRRTELFDRVPGPTLGMLIGALSMAAIVAIGYFALGGGDDEQQTATGIGSETEAGEGEQDPAGPTTGNSSAGGDQDADGGRGRFEREGQDGDAGDGSDDGSSNETTVPDGATSTTEGRTSSTSASSTTPTSTPSTTERETTTTERRTTTTERDTTTTTERETTTTERETTTVTTAQPVRITSGPRITFTGPTSFAFEYTINNVCGSGAFSVTRTSDGTPIGSFGGDGTCYGPVHGGFPQASHPVFGGYVLEPNTTYTVRATVTGVATDGSRPAGSGSDSITFQVTTAAG